LLHSKNKRPLETLRAKCAVTYCEQTHPGLHFFMDIDFAALTEHQRYKLMASLIVPRPIALVTTLGPDGVVNAAPSACSTCSAKNRRSS
jgi:hypothetical protein